MVINKGNYIAQCKKGTDSMNEEKIKRMLDACYLAKRTRELLPELPEGVTPAYIQYMDVIHKLQEKKERVKVSDISDTLKLPRPGVTRTAISRNMRLRRTVGSHMFSLQKKVRSYRISTIKIITAGF